jgi:bifunctional non-homologous end joining protein LigD
LPAFYDLLKKKPTCQTAYFAFDLLWLNGRDLRELPLLLRKKLLRSIIPRGSVCIGYVDFVNRAPDKLPELIKRHDLEGLIVKRKDGPYNDRARWYKVLNEDYSQKLGRRELFERN